MWTRCDSYSARYLMFLHHHSICKMFLRAVLFSIFLLNSPLSHLKEEKKMLRANQTYISLEKNDKKPPGSGVEKTVGGVSTQALAKAAFLRHFSRFLASVSESVLAFLRHFSGLFLVISWSMLFFTTKGSARQVQLQISHLKWPIYAINSVDKTKLPCYTLSTMQHHSFFRNLPPFFICLLLCGSVPWWQASMLQVTQSAILCQHFLFIF